MVLEESLLKEDVGSLSGLVVAWCFLFVDCFLWDNKQGEYLSKFQSGNSHANGKIFNNTGSGGTGGTFLWSGITALFVSGARRCLVLCA